jgi:hypothetical protein
VWTGFMWLGIVTSGLCEYGNEPSRSIKSGELLDQMSDTSQEGLCSMELVSLAS